MYPKDFLTSIKVQTMTTKEVGAYCLLLFNCWLQEDQGYLPNDDETLKALSKMTDKEWEKSKNSILKNFKKKGNKIFNKRMMKELDKLKDFSLKQSENGRRGGRPSKT